MRTRWLVCFSPLLLAGCDSGAGISKLGANLTLMPTEIDFGTVQVGATQRAMVTVSNRGTGPLHICTAASAFSKICPSPTHADPMSAPFAAVFDKVEADNAM